MKDLIIMAKFLVLGCSEISKDKNNVIKHMLAAHSSSLPSNLLILDHGMVRSK
jgi:hypothetical protein